MAITRRDLLVFGSGLTAGAGYLAWSRRPATPGSRLAGPGGPSGSTYAHGAIPPLDLGPLSLDPVTIPPPRFSDHLPATRRHDLQVVNQQIGVSVVGVMPAWTFGGSVPGPIIRATEGDTIQVNLANQTDRAHNIHFHGRHEIGADGWEPIPPGGKAAYRITAGPFGVHPYHCDFTPNEDHIANGLYGMMIVDPRGGRPPAREFALVLGGFDTDGDGKADIFGWNGVAGFFAKYPLKVTAGELVRVYLANMAITEPAASFHLHAETFDVFRSGTSLTPTERTDIVTLGPAERAIVEFRLPARGRYMFHPHQKTMAEHGAMGWFTAV